MSEEAIYRPGTPESYRRVRKSLRFILGGLARLNVSGQANIPAQGGLLLVSNHLSAFDIPVFGVTFERQAVVFIASKHRHNLIIAPIVQGSGCIWVQRGEADRAALKAALGVLKDGLALALAPEGTRSPTHALQPGKTGAAYIATRAGVPILPVVTWGVEQIKSALPRLRRAEVFVRYGRPFRLPDDPHARGEALETYTTEIMCRLAALLPEAYRGAYANQPRVAELLPQT